MMMKEAPGRSKRTKKMIVKMEVMKKKKKKKVKIKSMKKVCKERC